MPPGELENREKKHLGRRVVLMIVGLFFAGLGVAVTRHGGLGVSPISSVANVVAAWRPELSFGSWLLLWNCVLIVAQVVLLGGKFPPFQLLQVPLSVLFGWFADLGVWCMSFFPVSWYPLKIVVVLLGILVMSFGITLTLRAKVIMNSGEALVNVIAEKWDLKFSNVKIGFDLACVALAVVLSLGLFDFTVVGTREGTVLTALGTGLAIKFWQRVLPGEKEHVDTVPTKEENL